MSAVTESLSSTGSPSSTVLELAEFIASAGAADVAELATAVVDEMTTSTMREREAAQIEDVQAGATYSDPEGEDALAILAHEEENARALRLSPRFVDSISATPMAHHERAKILVEKAYIPRFYEPDFRKYVVARAADEAERELYVMDKAGVTNTRALTGAAIGSILSALKDPYTNPPRNQTDELRLHVHRSMVMADIALSKAHNPEATDGIRNSMDFLEIIRTNLTNDRPGDLSSGAIKLGYVALDAIDTAVKMAGVRMLVTPRSLVNAARRRRRE